MLVQDLVKELDKLDQTATIMIELIPDHFAELYDLEPLGDIVVLMPYHG